MDSDSMDSGSMDSDSMDSHSMDSASMNGASVDSDGVAPSRQLGSNQPKTARIAASIVGVIVVSLIALLAFAGPGAGSEAGALVGNRAPRVAGTTLTGEQFDMDDLRGSWVVVNFFATTCPGCVQEHPELIELSQWGKARGDVEIVAVVFNDSPEAVAQFFEQRGGDWPILDEPSVAVDYSVAQIPETFLVSPAGQVVLYVEGEVRAESVIGVIEGRS